MIDKASIENILFLDIETVPIFSSYDKVSKEEKALWDRKANYMNTAKAPEEEFYKRAGIYAEFGKVICISAGFAIKKGDHMHFRIKSYYAHNEKDLLTDFAKLLNKSFNKASSILCAHNGKEFDFPFLSRRMIINGIKLPKALNNYGKKPWEINHLDTMELWRFGDYKNFTSLELLAHVLKIKTPKSDMDGSMVCDTYYKDKNFKRIVKYCRQDVLTVAQILLRFRGEDLLTDEQIIIVDAI